MLRTLELDPGPVLVHDTGGDGPAVLFVHGLFVNHTLWDPVVAPLAAAGLRCIRPVLPLGAHTLPVRDRARLTPAGVAAMLEGLLTELDLRDTTIVANDTGGAITQMLLARRPDRVGRVVLTNCDLFDNFLPPAFRPLMWLARARLLGTAVQFLRIPGVAASPLGYGVLTRRPLPREVLRGWTAPGLASGAIRGDATRVTAAIRPRDLLETTERLRDCPVPFVLAWGRDDRFFTPALAQRFADLVPDGRVELIDDCATFVSYDQPARLIELIRDVVPAGVPAVA